MVSVTQVLDYFTEPELLAWYLAKGKAYCTKVSEEAKRVGTLVDAMVSSDIRGETGVESEGDEPVIQCMLAWQRFKVDYPRFSKQVLGIHEELSRDGVLGHPDMFIHDGTHYGVIDLKTSKAIQPKHWTQVAAYAWLKQSISYDHVFLAILRLDKQRGIYEYVTLYDTEEIEREVEVFQAYLTAYRHGERVRERMRRLREQEMLP